MNSPRQLRKSIKARWKRIRLPLEVWLGEKYLRATFRCGVNRYIDTENLDRTVSRYGSAILSIWHGQLMGGIGMMRDRGIHTIVGYHRDAEIAGRIARRLGFHLIRGSSRDRGGEALSGALDLMENSDAQLAITCDGPIGPYRKAKPGVAIIAHRAQVPVVPIGINGSRKKIITTSWDNFYLHLPFSKNVILFDEPVYPEDYNGSEPVNAMLREIENRMNRIQGRADHYFKQS